MDVQGVVLAAGEGTRLRPLTANKPKVLIDVAGKPILTHCFEQLVELGVAELLVVVGYRGEDVRQHYGQAIDGVPITYVTQHERKGMAHALLAARKRVRGDFVCRDGDCITRGTLDRLVELQYRDDVDGTVLLQEVSAEAARSKAICELNGDGEVTGLVNKPDDPPPRAYVAASCHTFSPAIFDACERTSLSPRGEYELAEAITLFVRDGRTVRGVPLDGWNVNVNTPSDLDRAEQLANDS